MSKIDFEEIKDVYITADLLYSEAEVEQAISQMAVKISAELEASDPLVIPIMNGGLVIGGKLLTKLNFPLEASYMHATRYRNTTSGHSLEWIVKPKQPLKDRVVLLIDDILDEGYTLAEIIEYCKQQGAAAVKVAVLVEKLHDRKAFAELKADYVGLTIEDRYIFGYGMDYKGYWRNAPGIFALKS